MNENRDWENIVDCNNQVSEMNSGEREVKLML